MSEMIEISGLWKGEGQNGPYLSGKVGNMVIFVFPNNNKTNDKAPDYRLCITKARKQEKEEENTGDVPF